MPKHSKLIVILRTCSVILLLSIPHHFLSEILSSATLPLWGGLCTATVHLLHKKKLRAIAVFAIGFSTMLILLAAALGILAAIPQLTADILYLRLSFIIGLLILTAFVVIIGTTVFLYSPCWHRYEPLAAILIFSLLFFPQRSYQLTAFSHPILAAGFASVFMFVQIALLCIPCLQYRRFFIFSLLFLPVIVALMLLLTQFFNKAAVSNNGGLLEQKLFDFDFSQFLRLQDSVKMNSHLVMIVHVDQEYSFHLFRRMYLSGWHRQKGFYEKTAPDEIAQVLQVPKQPSDIPHQPFQSRVKVSQEIFTVNLDPTSLIALDYPVSVTPYTVWDSLSFKGAYKTESEILHGIPLDLITADAPSGNPAEGLSKKALEFYTAIDSETKNLVRPIAESITSDFALYYDKIYSLLEYFREGDYRYSLQPGQAPDGDQLRYFITESKKGYCSYFAFSYCLMLRSLGIPARVAAGFFLQPEAGVLNYYPVRANMAHAWVEVFFPYLGWVGFDPTTEQLADGERADFSFQAGGDQFTKLLDEILLNRSTLKIQREPLLTDGDITFIQQFHRFLQQHTTGIIGAGIGFVIVLGLLFMIYPSLIVRFSKNNRKVILTLKKIHKYPSPAFFALTQKAKFAPSCTEADVKAAKQLYYSEHKHRCFWNRILFIALFMLLPFRLLLATEAENLLHNADKALQAENWDTAASLLEEGINRYPTNELFHLKLGDMYFNNGLYELAYRRFTEGLNVNKYNIKLLYGAANAAAALNKDEQARNFLYEYLSYNPTDIFAWSSYGWLCFKTHKTEEGIHAMLKARSNYGDDGSIANALGNLYGELFDYRNAASYYRKGIELALQTEAYYSASVYSYNKAILEAMFYRFAEAEEDARNAVTYFSRASGYLMLGELEERKNNFTRAITYYLQATENNHTPLPLINLAKIYLRMGHWKEAERYAAQIERITDYSWIANFGMSTVQFYAELHGIYKTLYEKKYAAEKMRIPESIIDIFIRQKNLLHYATLSRYYRASCSLYHKKLAEEYILSGTNSSPHELYLNSFYYRAFESAPFKARRYLQKAEQLETQFIPQSQASYTAEKGILFRNGQLLEEALHTLDPIWEKELWEQTAAVLAKITHNASLKNALYTKLMQSNPACFPTHWIRLPIRLVYTSTDINKTQSKKHLVRALKQSLFTLAENAPFTITATCSPESTQLSLIGEDGTLYFRYTHPAPILTKTDAAICINQFAPLLFQIRE